jgi:hypothetical protein
VHAERRRATIADTATVFSEQAADSDADTDASATGTPGPSAAARGAEQGEGIVESRRGCNADEARGEARCKELERDRGGHSRPVREVLPPQVV